MKKEKVNTFKLGLFVSTAVVLFVAAIYFIGNEQNLFRPTFQLNVVFRNAEGLKPGNNVRYAGIDAGTVENIVITSDSTLRVEMALHREMQQYIRKDAIASIGTDGLVGNKLINISPSQERDQQEIVGDQEYIRSNPQVNTNDMLEVLDKTNKNIALFSQQLLAIAEEVNTGKGTMNMLLQDPVLADDLLQSVTNLKYTTRSLRELGGNLQQTLALVNGGDGLLHDLLYDTVLMYNVQSLSENLNGVLTQKVEPLLDNLHQSAENISQSSTTLNELLQTIRDGEGPIGTLLRDTSVENDLQVTLTNIRQSSEKFNENMEAMRHNFLFRAYFKKLEKQEKKSLK